MEPAPGRKHPAAHDGLSAIKLFPQLPITYVDLAVGFGIGTTTVYRYLREALDLLAAMTPTLQQAIEVARGKAYVILDGTLLRIDRVGMVGGRDRPYYSGKHKCHGLNVQVIADPAGRLMWVSPTLPDAFDTAEVPVSTPHTPASVDPANGPTPS